MRRTLVIVTAVLCMGSPALAQTTPSTDGETPAVATPDTSNPTAPVAGANSFTEAQAKERIEAAGFSNVTALKLDDQGVWQATAMKDGKSATVALDYQGNVTAK
nr:PepSY domain-containing protein [Ensifer sp.]